MTLPSAGALIATGVYSDATQVDLSTSVSWSAVGPLSATYGVVSASGTGLGSVTAFVAGTSLSARSSVAVHVGSPAQIYASANPTMPLGFSSRLSAEARYDDPRRRYGITSDVAWQVDDLSIASVTGSSLVTHSPGSTSFRAILGAVVSDAPTITVTAAKLQTVAVTAQLATEIDRRPELAWVTGWFDEPNVPGTSVIDITADATFTTDDPMVMTVSNDAATKGALTRIKLGTTTLTATVGGMSATTVLVVTWLGPEAP